MMQLTAEQIVQAVKAAGIVGAGGGGFPAYVKLQATVDTIIANGSECEPLLSGDQAMMEKHPDKLIDGMQIAMKATGAKKGIIGLKEHYHGAISALQKVLPKDGSIKLHLLENYYPAGDEFLLVYEATGRVMPEGGIPLHVGVVVNNVVTFMQMADAVHGKPVTDRIVTLAGEYRQPKIVVVPVGASYRDLVALAGGTSLPEEDIALIDGGPMMGKLVENWDTGIAKTTSGILALPKDHFLVTMRNKSLSKMVRLSQSACCQCFRCSDLCPRNLLGHDLYPHMTMRTIGYNQSEPTQHVTSAFLCSQCGVCELIACDIMQLSPRKIFAAYKTELSKRGLRSPHQRKNLVARETFSHRKLPIDVVLKKLGITQYAEGLSFAGEQVVRRVQIPLNKHIGAPAVPCVKVGQRVRMCDLIAASPEDQLGTTYHASIGGKVTSVTKQTIEIKVN